MVTPIKSLKRPPYPHVWEAVFQSIGTFACIVWPGGTLLHAYIFQGVWLDDPWRWVLLGIGSLLFLICIYLKTIRDCLQAPVDVMYMVLKNPEDDERGISQLTVHHLRQHLRQLLGLNDSES